MTPKTHNDNGATRWRLDPAQSTAEFRVPHFWGRDHHLRSADFFDTQRHPALRFCSTRVSDAGDGHLSVIGELCAAGRQVTLTLQPTLRQVGDQLQVDASTTVDQRALGMTWSPLGVTRTPTTLTVHAQLHLITGVARGANSSLNFATSRRRQS
jgi:polyisoprenoid-binding protein YceI